MTRIVSPVVMALMLALVVALGACTPVKPKPPLTELAIRARFTPEHTATALAKIPIAATRLAIERHLAERELNARPRRVIIDDARVGETIDAGGGIALERVFVLFHEFDARGFTTYLEGIEVIAGRRHNAYRLRVGASEPNRTELTEIDAVDLNRVFLRRFVPKAGDLPCCPTDIQTPSFVLTPNALEPLP